MMQNRRLRIAVADDEPDMLMFFREVLPGMGHEVVAQAETGRELIQRCLETGPDLVITDIMMPDLDGLEAAATVNRQTQVPVIVVTAHHDADNLARGAGAAYVMSYLAKPVKPNDLEAAVRLAMLRFSHFQTLAQEAADLRQALEDRKQIERAKGAVMKRVGVDEEEAFRRLRKLASDQNRKLIDIARQVGKADEVFRQFDRG
ncbi:MAG TPA: response regulator [Gemmataceae bacterium]|nr:response regulator [Gemmataceae bacterium]